jgi:DNA-directed RNA polymerase specialized sigma24 family protein
MRAPGVLDKSNAAPTVIPMDPVLDTPTTIIDFETPTARSRVITARAAVEEAQEQLLTASQHYRDEVRAYFWSRRQSNVSHRKIAEELGIADTTLRELLRFNRRSTR